MDRKSYAKSERPIVAYVEAKELIDHLLRTSAE
jgi:hypothetical protein